MARRNRPAARVLVIDRLDRVLLFRFTPPDRSPLWATPGGEVDRTESFDEAARRELLEETGIDVDPGPCIAKRESDFITFAGEPVHAVEQYFAVRVDECAITGNAHTPSEQAVMLSHRWWTIDEIENAAEPIFPSDLSSIIRDVLSR
jgi:8-oxo-dGTP diphosphatase